MEEKTEDIVRKSENTESRTDQEDTGCTNSEKNEHSSEEPQSPSPAALGDFSDPVYKEIALANGTINRMSRDELRAKCAKLKLDTRGVKDVLRKRLKNYYKKQKLKQTAAGGPGDTYYDYICVVDFEATCEENNPHDFLHEIIEFPMVLIDTRTLEIEDSFQEYVKPEVNPQLSDFCVELTGITQPTRRLPDQLYDRPIKRVELFAPAEWSETLEIRHNTRKMVDEACTFSSVLQRVVAWLQEKELGTKYKYALLTDGSWDMSKFLYTQCRLSGIRYPQFAKKWINIRKSYGNYYKVARSQTKLKSMLENLGMQYEGRLHCGLDDSRNIARIAISMLKDGCQLRVNEHLHGGQPQSVPVSAPFEGAPPPQKPRSRN